MNTLPLDVIDRPSVIIFRSCTVKPPDYSATNGLDVEMETIKIKWLLMTFKKDFMAVSSICSSAIVKTRRVVAHSNTRADKKCN